MWKGVSLKAEKEWFMRFALLPPSNNLVVFGSSSPSVCSTAIWLQLNGPEVRPSLRSSLNAAFGYKSREFVYRSNFSYFLSDSQGVTWPLLRDGWGNKACVCLPCIILVSLSSCELTGHFAPVLFAVWVGWLLASRAGHLSWVIFLWHLLSLWLGGLLISSYHF